MTNFETGSFLCVWDVLVPGTANESRQNSHSSSAFTRRSVCTSTFVVFICCFPEHTLLLSQTDTFVRCQHTALLNRNPVPSFVFSTAKKKIIENQSRSSETIAATRRELLFVAPKVLCAMDGAKLSSSGANIHRPQSRARGETSKPLAVIRRRHTSDY